jgi:rubredoxin
MRCEFCGYEFSDELGRYGCPNCEGEGLMDNSKEESARLAGAMAAVNELSKSMDLPTGRNYQAWNARKQEAAAKRRMNSKPEDR